MSESNTKDIKIVNELKSVDKGEKISDSLRALDISLKDNVPLDKALEIAIKERQEKEAKMGPPQTPPREAYEEEYFRLKGNFEKK